MSQIGMLAVVMAVASGVALAGDPGWNAAMSAIQIDCSQPGVSQDIIPFVGFKDECDDDTKVIYEPKDSTQHLDMVIDARNSDTVEWDTARYKRYGTYWPTSNVTWHVPNGFTNFWSRIYYAVDNDKKFEPMKYQYSKDGQAWTPVPNVQYDVNVVCIQEGCNWYKRKEEQASWSEPMFYFKAIWPAPCAGEIGATYAADQRKCLSLPPPGWTGTLEEFDASPIKDLYYTPQMAEIHMGTSDLTPGSPQNLKLTPGQGSVLATWDPPANPKEPIIGYVVYYQLDSPAAATMPNYKPPYLASHMNVGMVSGVVLKNISPTSTIIVRVAAVTQRGAGPSTLNVWTQPNGNGVPSCPASLPPVATVSPQGLTPAPDGAQGGHQQLTGNANHQSTSTSDAHGSVLSALVIFLASIIFVLF